MRLSWHIASAREPPRRARVCQERAAPEVYPRSRLRAMTTR